MTAEIMPDRDVPAYALEPGTDVIIWRYTENRRKGDVLIPLPCHQAEKVVWTPYLPGTRDRLAVVCRACERTWDMQLHSEIDGGWQASFTLAPDLVLLSKARR